MDVVFNRRGDEGLRHQLGGALGLRDRHGDAAKVGDILLSPQTDPLQADHPTRLAANPVSDEAVRGQRQQRHGLGDRLTAPTRSRRPSPSGSMPGGPKGRRRRPRRGARRTTLYVAHAGENAVAVVDTRDARASSASFRRPGIPPDVRVTPDGRRAGRHRTRTTRARGRIRAAVAARPEAADTPEYAGHVVDPPPDQYVGLDDQGLGGGRRHPAAAATARRAWPLDGAGALQQPRRRAPLAGAAAARTAIKHVIYVIKENRTYDQVFGDMPEGNGDPALDAVRGRRRRRTIARWPAASALSTTSTPTREVSRGRASTGRRRRSPPTTSRKTWPFDYALARYYRAYDFEYVPLRAAVPERAAGERPVVRRSAAAATAGLPVGRRVGPRRVVPRLRGVHVRAATAPDRPTSAQRSTSRTCSRVRRHVDPTYPGYNLACPDHTTREPEWEREFHAFERERQPARAVASCASRATTPGARPAARRRRRPTWPTTTWRSGSSSTRLALALLAEHRDLRDRGRRAGRPRPRRRAPHGGAA